MFPTLRLISVTLVALTLAACGGSGGGSSNSSSPGQSSSSATSSSTVSSTTSSSSSASSSSMPALSGFTGIFVDSAVAGIGYRTSPSGNEGITSTNGEYLFEEGDTVVFFIGELELPRVQAKGIVTPLDIAETDDPNDPVVVNIARLLQSLDADGDPSNGITIPAGAAAVATAVDFEQSVEDFAADTAIVNLVANAGGSNTTLISTEAAIAHLLDSVDQQRQSLIGSWYYQDISDPDVDKQFHIVLTFLDEERYTVVTDEDESDDDSGWDGFEYGTYTWNLRTGVAGFVQITDTNGEWGASDLCENEVFVLELRGQTLYLHSDGEVGGSCSGDGANDRIAFQRVESETDPLVGSWLLEDDDTLVVFTFTADGYYLMLQDSPADDSGQPGIERGTYTLDSATNEIRAVTQTDTNGQWGLSHPCSILDVHGTNRLDCGENGQDILQTLTVEGDTLVFVNEADTIAFGEEEAHVLIRIGTSPYAGGGEGNPQPFNVTGTWAVTITEVGDEVCGDDPETYTDDFVVVQQGTTLTVTDIRGSYTGSISGTSLVWSGPYQDEDGGGDISITATFDTSGAVPTISGSTSWTFTDSEEEFSCSGTSTFSGELQAN